LLTENLPYLNIHCRLHLPSQLRTRINRNQRVLRRELLYFRNSSWNRQIVWPRLHRRKKKRKDHQRSELILRKLPQFLLALRVQSWSTRRTLKLPAVNGRLLKAKVVRMSSLRSLLLPLCLLGSLQVIRTMQITQALQILKTRKKHQQAGKILMKGLERKNMLCRISQKLIVIMKQQQRTTKKKRKRRKKLILKSEGEWNSGSVWRK
jgi:hypothetical protein